MPQSEHSWLRKLFRRLLGLLPRRAHKEPDPPVDPYAYALPQRSPGHRIAAARPSLSYRKTKLIRPTTAGKTARLFEITCRLTRILL